MLFTFYTSKEIFLWFILKSNALEQKPFTSLFLELNFINKSKIKKSGPRDHVSPPYSFILKKFIQSLFSKIIQF